MIKLMIVGRRAPGNSRAATHAHLRDVHGPMVVLPPDNAGAMPVGYVQNHVIDGVYPGGEARHVIERDLVTELWFASVDQMRASVATPYYLTNLKPDEPRFVDDATVERIVVAETCLRDGARGPCKLFAFASADQRDAAITALAGAPTIVDNVVQPSPFGPPFAAHVIEGWFDDEHAARAALDNVAVTAVIAREYSTETLRALHAAA